MDNMLQSTSSGSGIISLSGFAYQIKIFIYLLAKLNENEQIEFETLDDVTIRNIAENDTQNDYCIKSQKDSSGNITVFQVKQTTVSKAKCRDILYNWLLALDKNREIKHFVLYVEKGYSVNLDPFSSGAAAEFATIIQADPKKKATSLISKVKSIYKDNEEQFSKDYEFICANYRVAEIEDIEKTLATEMNAALHLDANSIGPVYAQRRVEEVITKVCARIMTSVSQRKPFMTQRQEYMQICEEVCRNISPTQYSPDYASFERLYAFNEVSDDIAASREYKQLQYCNLPDTQVFNYLLNEQYYKQIRQHYLLDAQQSQIEAIEGVVYQNHAGVVAELELDNKDVPRRRFLHTIRQPISYLSNEQSRWGAYVFQTNESAVKQISWKDEEDE